MKRTTDWILNFKKVSNYGGFITWRINVCIKTSKCPFIRRNNIFGKRKWMLDIHWLWFIELLSAQSDYLNGSNWKYASCQKNSQQIFCDLDATEPTELPYLCLKFDHGLSGMSNNVYKVTRNCLLNIHFQTSDFGQIWFRSILLRNKKTQSL